MKTIRAKFKCDSITEYSFSKEAKFSAVYGKEGENADFTEATPTGQLSISISKTAPASSFIEVGASYYLDFTKADN